MIKPDAMTKLFGLITAGAMLSTPAIPKPPHEIPTTDPKCVNNNSSLRIPFNDGDTIVKNLEGDVAISRNGDEVSPWYDVDDEFYKVCTQNGYASIIFMSRLGGKGADDGAPVYWEHSTIAGDAGKSSGMIGNAE